MMVDTAIFLRRLDVLDDYLGRLHSLGRARESDYLDAFRGWASASSTPTGPEHAAAQRAAASSARAPVRMFSRP